MKKSNRSTVIRLFFCLALVLVVISCSIFSSLRTATAVTPANSTFGFYFGPPVTNATTTPSKNASSPSIVTAVTPANSTFGFYFGPPTTNATAIAKALTTPGAAILNFKSMNNKYGRNEQMSTLKGWSIIPSLSQNK